MATLSNDERAQLGKWISESGELWVDVHLVHGGGSSTDYFVCSIDELEALIAQQTHRELVVSVFRRIQFPVRGVADERLQELALQQIPDGQWYEIVSLDHYYPSSIESFGGGNSHAELRQEFSEVLGERIGIGQNPFDGDTNWIHSSPDEVLVLHLKKEARDYARA